MPHLPKRSAGLTPNVPRVSVVIPAWNVEAVLEKTLESVSAQTFRDFEVIVIDDGSDDDTPQILEASARKWSWLRWERQINAGVASARSRGIELARGEWIAFLDADDLWLPEKLAFQIALIEQDPQLALVYCDVRNFSGERESKRSLFDERSHATGAVLRELFMNNFVYTSTVLLKKSALVQVGGFNSRHQVNEDVDLWLRVAEHFNFGCVNEVLVKYRRAPGTLTRTHPYECLHRDLEIIDYWVRRRPDLFAEDSPQVQAGRALTFARLGAQHLFDRDFAAARRAFHRAIGLGQRNPSTLLRAAASHFPPLAYSFWGMKIVLRQFSAHRLSLNR